MNLESIKVGWVTYYKKILNMKLAISLTIPVSNTIKEKVFYLDSIYENIASMKMKSIDDDNYQLYVISSHKN